MSEETQPATVSGGESQPPAITATTTENKSRGSSRSRDKSRDRSDRSSRRSRRSRSRSRDNRDSRRDRRSYRSRSRDRRGGGHDNGRGYQNRGYQNNRGGAGGNNRGYQGGGHFGGRIRQQAPSFQPPQQPVDPNLTPMQLAEKAREREIAAIERDQRTVFACQIHPKVDERDIFQFFSQAGTVTDVQLIRDIRTGKSKGLCYVEFEVRETVPIALAFSGQLLGGFPITVQVTQAEKNRAAAASKAAAAAAVHMNQMKLFIGNLNPQVSVEDLRPVFEAFGPVDSVEISTTLDPEGALFGYVLYRKQADGQAAMSQLNALEILGRAIKVVHADLNASLGTSGGAVAQGFGAGQSALAALQDQQSVAELTGMNPSRVDEDEDNQGMHMNSASRSLLMQKLGGGVMASQATQNQLSSMSTCCILKNMFDSTEESDDFENEIKEDVSAEVARHGELLHISVDKYSQGHVYLKFRHAHSAQATINALAGRWFAKKQIQADFFPESDYQQKFGV